MSPRLQGSILALSLLLLVTAISLIYRSAFPGLLLFDDIPNLQQLSHVTDWTSALNFIVSGHAGPLGRPLALATFVAQADAWPNDPAALLGVNILIHLLAIGAALTLAWGLARIRRSDQDLTIPWIALGAAALWGLSPFLATSSLIIIQRMASLSGLFVLAGLAAFVWAHVLAPSRPRLAHLFLVLGLGLGTLLAALSKENGALLPLLALVILWLWIPPERRLNNRVDRSILLLLAILPSLTVLVYLGFIEVPQIIEHGYRGRYFTVAERLMAQPTILLDYLQNLLLPRAIAVTPFMDRYPVPQGWLQPPITLAAALFWPGLLAVAIWLRRRTPFLLFGVTFFLVGHLLESTFIGLELYFAHRNYVPAFGIYFAVVYAATTAPPAYRRLAALSIGTYAVLFAAVLLQVTSSWSHPVVSGELWLRYNPYSERAADFLAKHYILQLGDRVTAQRILDDAAARLPRAPYIQIMRMQVCQAGEANSLDRLETSVTRLRKAYFEPVGASQLLLFTQMNPAAYCPGQGYSFMGALADALLANPPYARSSITKAQLLATKGLVSIQKDNYAEGIALLTESFRLHRDLDIAFFAGSAMSNAGRKDELRAFLAQVRKAAPNNFLRREIWLRRLDAFCQIVGVNGAKLADAKL